MADWGRDFIEKETRRRFHGMLRESNRRDSNWRGSGPRDFEDYYSELYEAAERRARQEAAFRTNYDGPILTQGHSTTPLGDKVTSRLEWLDAPSRMAYELGQWAETLAELTPYSAIKQLGQDDIGGALENLAGGPVAAGAKRAAKHATEEAADAAAEIVNGPLAKNTATSAARQALPETMTPGIGDRTGFLPAQPRQGFALVSPDHELAGLFREGVQPDMLQTPILRYDPPRGVSPRVADLVVNPNVRQKVIETIDRGIRMGGLDWYNAEPLRLAFIDELGVIEGNRRFNHFIDLVAATSARSRVPENVRNASYYYTLSDDQRLPETNPYPYGHRAQKMHRGNVERVWSGGLNPITHSKSVSMGANAKGNYLPVTIDMHAYRLLAMLSGDPRFLATFVPMKLGAPRNIRKEFGAGLIGPDELGEPKFWLPQPGRNEYAALERYFQEIARELGLTPAQAQSAAWVAGAELTGLRSDPTKKFMDFFKDRLLYTARKMNMDPRDVLKRTIRGQLSLLTLGGVALAPQLRSPEEEEGRR
jgi:hypothetical protein